MAEKERFKEWMEQNGAIATRRSLISRLKDWEDQESWRQFFDTYWRLIFNIARKSGLTEVEAQEVVQETVIALAKKIGDFKHNQRPGAFKGWLIQMTQWRICDQFRKRNNDAAAPDEGPEGENATDSIPDPGTSNVDEQWEQDWRQNMLDAALDRIRAKVPAKQFQAFDLYVTRKWTPAAVARAVGLPISQIYLIKFRMMKLLRAEVKRLEKQLI